MMLMTICSIDEFAPLCGTAWRGKTYEGVKNMEVYRGTFSDWSDVQREFNMSMSEPEQVLIAFYDDEDYSGDAYVLWREGNQIFEVIGGHCSCYGLEDQWPDTVESEDIVTFLAALNQQKYGYAARNREMIKAALGVSQ